MKLSDKTKEALKKLNYTVTEITSGELHDMAPSLGYESMGYGTTYKDGTTGLLIRFPEPRNKYNNGVYMLHKLEKGEIVLEVIEPNTKDKGNMIMHLVDDISNHIDGMDMFDMQVFDYTEMYGYVIANTVIKPLAKTLFPNDKVKQEHFTMLYLPRFLANVAYQYTGSDNIYEEGVNSEPYVLKMMIDQETDKSKNDKTDNSKNKATEQNKADETKNK